MKLSFVAWWSLVKRSASAWIADYAPSMGAALSYYTVFSMAPMLLIVIAIAGLVFGEDAARGALFEQLSGMMGAEGAKAVEGLLASASKPSEGIIATVVGLVVLLLGATTVFGELQDALDRIWRAPEKQEGGRSLGFVESSVFVVRNDPGNRVPADGLAGGQRRGIGAGQMVEPSLWWLGSPGPNGDVRVRTDCHNRGFCVDLQVHSTRDCPVA